MDGAKAQHGELHAALVAAMAAAEGEGGAPKNARKLKTTAPAPEGPQDLVAAKRRPGGQPGNRNACKTGRHSAAQKARRRDIRSLKRRARAAVATVNGFLRKQRDEAKHAPP